ncbi:MAG: MFS transporter [bacterium]|nr:MFS transporter [bacterium]
MNRKLLFRKDVLSWCLYDWANSAFVTTVVTVVLPIYFLTLMPAGKGPVTVELGSWSLHTNGDALWTYFTGLYMLAAGLTAPFIGAIADYSRNKKRFLCFCVGVGALLTVMLATVGTGQYLRCGLIFAAAAFLWSCGNLFYDALLPELTGVPREMDAVSSTGYAIGYLGGGLLLAVNLAMISKPGWFGFTDAGAATRGVFITVGLWWVVFSLPVLCFTREASGARSGARRGNPVVEGWRQLWSTLREIRRYRHLLRLLIAFIFYNTGIGTVITVAALYGKAELGLSDGTLIGCILMIQFVGVPATFGFMAIASRVGARNGIFIGLAVYIVVVVFAFFMSTATEFWILGGLIALVLGGTQALSRSLYGSMIPEGQSAEFFGFFSIFNKVGSFAGPLCFGVVRDLTDSSRLAILFLAVFFVIGLVVLLTVNPDEGRAVRGTP